jgi:hypothetical protein
VDLTLVLNTFFGERIAGECMNILGKGFFLAGATLVVSAANAQIAQWNFNGASSTTIPGGVSTPTPSTGAGTASLLNGVVGSFSSGSSNGGSSDPAGVVATNFGWGTSTYSAQNADSGVRGIRFDVSTVGQSNIKVSWDTRHSNTSSRWTRFDYTVNGGSSWVNGSAATSTVYEGTAGDTWFNNRSVDLSNVSAVANNALFGFRIVTVFGPAAGPFDDSATYTGYNAATSASAYATTGTLRYDMVTVVPEPASMIAIASGLIGLAARRRKN